MTSGVYIRIKKQRTIEDLIKEFGEIPYCQCDSNEGKGCGQKVNISVSNYQNYRNRGGFPKLLPHHNTKGENNPFFGKKHTEISILKQKESAIGKHCGELNPFYGKIHTIEFREKSRQQHLGIHPTDEARYKMSISHIGESHLGWKHKNGEDHWNWQGGISFGIYCPKFNNKKREEIRNLYNRKCIICGKDEKDNKTKKEKNIGRVIKLHVHHIDYNKLQGCEDHEWRLVPLCMSCHGKTNGKKSRIFWENNIKEILHNIDINMEKFL